MLKLLTTLILLISPIAVLAEDFYIEDEKLQKLPQSIVVAIQTSEGFTSQQCNLVGKVVNLSGKNENSGYIATTQNGCEWGGAQGPIWLIYNNQEPVAVLSTFGYSVTIGKPVKNGLRNIAVSFGTAGYYSESLYKYNGKKYILTKNKTNKLHSN